MRLPPWLWRVLRSKRTRTALIWSPWVAIASVTLFYAAVNWWGERVFWQTVEELEARGFPRTLEEAMAAVPAKEDFFLQPGVQAEMDELVTGRKLGQIADFGLPGVKPGVYEPWSDRKKGKVPDFRSLLTEPPATDQEAAKQLWEILETVESRRKELLEVKFVHAPLNLDNSRGERGRLSFTNSIVPFVQEHALTAIHSGHAMEALEDMEFLFSLNAAIQRSAYGQFEGVAAVGMASTPIELVFEALRLNALDDEQWSQIDSSISKFPRAITPSTAQRFSTSHHIEDFIKAWPSRNGSREKPYWDVAWNGDGLAKTLKAYARHFRPQGFRDLNLAAMLRAGADFAQPDGKNWRGPVTVEDYRRVERRLAELSLRSSLATTEILELPDQPEELFWSTLKMTIERALKLQAELSLARSAIALERHRLRHHRHPATLDDLESDLLKRLPGDPMVEKALRYRLDPAGGFTLWSVGLDGKDDGAGGDDWSWRQP